MSIKPIPIPGPGVVGGPQQTTVGVNAPVELRFTAEGVFWRDPNGNTFTGKLFQGLAKEEDGFVSFTPEIPVDVFWRFLPSDGSPETTGRILVREGACGEDSVDSEEEVQTSPVS